MMFTEIRGNAREPRDIRIVANNKLQLRYLNSAKRTRRNARGICKDLLFVLFLRVSHA